MNGLRRFIVGAVVAAAAPAVIAMPVANANPACDTAINEVNGYLDRHPDVNQALIDINNENPGEVRDAYSTYFDNHPDVANELRALKDPLNTLHCVSGLPDQITNALAAL